MEEGLGAHDPKVRQRTKTRLFVAAGGGLLLLVVVAGAMLLLRGSTSPLPEAIRAQATFPVYYPTKIPDGFTIDPGRVTYSANVDLLTVPMQNPNGHSLTMTEQPLPANLTFKNLVGQGTVLDGINGQAVISSVESRIVATMISPDNKTLILLNSSYATKDELTSLLKSLRLAK